MLGEALLSGRNQRFQSNGGRLLAAILVKEIIGRFSFSLSIGISSMDILETIVIGISAIINSDDSSIRDDDPSIPRDEDTGGSWGSNILCVIA